MKRYASMGRPKPHLLSNCPDGRWLRVALGDKGDSLEWKEGYEVLENVRWLLGRLEEFGEEKADLASHFVNLPFFAGLAGCSFPPLYHESDFDCMSFMKHKESLGWREHRWVGFSSAEVGIFVWSSKRKELLSQARVLARRLEATLQILDAAQKETQRAQKRFKRVRRMATEPKKTSWGNHDAKK
jgi:hypothetical protein